MQVVNSKLESYIFLPEDRDQQASILSDKDIHSFLPEDRNQQASTLSDKDIHIEVMENLYRLSLPWQEKVTMLCAAVPDLKYSLPYIQFWLKTGKLTKEEYSLISTTLLLSSLKA